MTKTWILLQELLLYRDYGNYRDDDGEGEWFEWQSDSYELIHWENWELKE